MILLQIAVKQCGNNLIKRTLLLVNTIQAKVWLSHHLSNSLIFRRQDRVHQKKNLMSVMCKCMSICGYLCVCVCVRARALVWEAVREKYSCSDLN